MEPFINYADSHLGMRNMPISPLFPGLLNANNRNALETYNSEVARGLAHTNEYKQKMQQVQAELDRTMRGLRNAQP